MRFHYHAHIHTVVKEDIFPPTRKLDSSNEIHPYRLYEFSATFRSELLQLERKCLKEQAKVEVLVDTQLRRCLSLKGWAEACTAYIFPSILYRLSVLTSPKGPQLALQQTLSTGLWGGRKSMVRWRVFYQRPCDGGFGTPDLESHWLAERLAFLGRYLTRDAE